MHSKMRQRINVCIEWFEISSVFLARGLACMNCLILQLNCRSPCKTVSHSSSAQSAGVDMCVVHSMQITSLVYVMTEMCNKIKWREALFILCYLSASPSSRKVEGVTQSAVRMRFCSSPRLSENLFALWRSGGNILQQYLQENMES